MLTSATINKMLYCPKCQKTYEDGRQRFCSDDRERLVPVLDPSKSSKTSGGVFASLLGKTEPPGSSDEKLAALPRFETKAHSNLPVYEIPSANPQHQADDDLDIELELDRPLAAPPAKPQKLQPEQPQIQKNSDASEPNLELEAQTAFESPTKFESPAEFEQQQTQAEPQTKFEQPKFEQEPKFELQTEFEPTLEFDASPAAMPEPALPEILEISSKPAAKSVDLSEIPSGTAPVGDRRANPVGRDALGWHNPQVLFGAHVKGRYAIVRMLGQDETSFSYLADDQLVADKKVVVRVFVDESSDDDFLRRIHAEERVSLAHIEHPNIIKVIDSGDLLEGKQFIVTEYIDAESVADALKEGKLFNAQRTARIVRQTAYGLSEAHQNGILHRSLRPSNLLLDITENGIEQVKLTNFGVSGTRKSDPTYRAPEILEGKQATFSGDIYSLAVIAYQMLTGELPFAGENERELLKKTRESRQIPPSILRAEIPPAIDAILEKALAYPPADRYPKARDFGDAFFHAMTTAAPSDFDAADEAESLTADSAAAPPNKTIILFPIGDDKTKNGENEQFFAPNETDFDTAAGENEKPIFGETFADAPPLIGDIHITPREEFKDSENAPSDAADAKTGDPTWTRRSPEPPKTASRFLLIASILGLVLLLAGIWGIWTYFLSRPPHEPQIGAQPTAPINAQPTIQTSTPNTQPQNSTVSNADISEVPPLPRQIAQPAGTLFFQNSKQDAKGDLLRNFLSFTLYYPESWKINKAQPAEKAGARGKFLDISRSNADGLPIENMLISYYESKGTFKADAENFAKLVKETNETLKNIVPNYQMLSEGEIKVNGDWKAYEIKFQGGGDTPGGEKLNLWGRRLFIPMGRPGVRSGYEITMFATSLSPDVKSVDDVGVKGELATVLQTFEPNQNF